MMKINIYKIKLESHWLLLKVYLMKMNIDKVKMTSLYIMIKVNKYQILLKSQGHHLLVYRLKIIIIKKIMIMLITKI